MVEREGIANGAGHDGTALEELAEKYEQLKDQMEQYFDDTNPQSRGKIPVAKAPEKFTKEEWLQRQATHTPFAPWCKHCLAARMTRHKHPSKGRRAMMVKDAEDWKADLPKSQMITCSYTNEQDSTEKMGIIHHRW